MLGARGRLSGILCLWREKKESAVPLTFKIWVSGGGFRLLSKNMKMIRNFYSCQRLVMRRIIKSRNLIW